ncbi:MULTISPECIES: DUF1868 domain-containing protein [unclassified Sphingopyxis]|uniref:DUF1868 domain-containing protein n=1 Tax=unclassified Sphingopyxis TaxID=2614943 RepID=UPI0009EBC996|nr:MULTISPECIES: DUF1868 domain-containing protein [unclassified Sphingopyxis]
MSDSRAYPRREFFAAGAAAALLAAAPAMAKPASNERDATRKFFPDGRVHPFAGNTIICHLDQQGPRSSPFDTMLDIYRELPGRNYARKLALLPPSSYHMTLFGGATDANRAPGQWPRDVPADASIAECNRIVGERLRTGPVASPAEIRMKVDTSDSGYDGNTLRIPLAPRDAAEAETLSALRDSWSDVVGVRSPRHDEYQFHITIGYLIRPLSPRETRDALADMASWKARMTSRSPIIEFGRPEYCTFDDMFAFKRQFFL